MISFPFISVIIPVYNEEYTIEKTICSVFEQDYQGLWEILVIDGMSTDRTRDIIYKLIPLSDERLKLIDNQKRIIPSAMNLGIKASKGEVIVRLDGHTFVEKNYLSCVAAKLESTEAACLGPKMIMLSSDSIASQAIAAALSTPFGPGTSGFRYSDKEEYADTMNFGVYRRDLFDEVGYFDTNLLANEDYEIHYRIRQAGYKILYTPSLKVYYFVRNSFTSLWKQYLRYGFWKSQMLRKWPGSVRLRHFVAPIFVFTLVIGIILALLSEMGKIFLIVILIIYFLTASIFATLQVAEQRQPNLIARIIFAFAIMHIGWGSGFWHGIIKQIHKST